MVGSRLACLPLPFICLPLLSFVSQFFSVLVVGFPAGLSPTSFHLSPTSFHLSPSSFHLSPTACGRVPTSFHVSPSSFHLSPSSFHLSPRLGAWSGSRLACLPLPFICLPLLFIYFPVLFICLRLGGCDRAPTSFFTCVSHFFIVLACLPLPFICLSLPFMCLPLLFICLPVLFICLPGWVLASWPCSASIHLSPRSNSFVFQVCRCWCPPFSTTGHVVLHFFGEFFVFR